MLQLLIIVKIIGMSNAKFLLTGKRVVKVQQILQKRLQKLLIQIPLNLKLYMNNQMSLWNKTKYIAQNIYGAADIIADKKIRNQFQKLEDDGFGEYPICMAKTQYSFSTDPLLMGAPSGHDVPVKEVRLISRCRIYCGCLW